jgi:type IX secretion system PorP/SprF family membrane protein
MKIRTRFILFYCLINIQIYLGQDIHFTQFFAAPVYLNPAFTGANVCSRTTLIYRNQWPEVNKAYQTYLLSFDHYIQRSKLGLGLICAVDDAGSGGLRTTIVSSSFAYEIKIKRTMGIRFGVQPGVMIKSINFDKLIFGDQLARGGNTGAKNITTVETPAQNKAFFDIGAGALFYYSNLWIGTSFSHLNRPNESFFGNDEVFLPIKYSVHGGTKFTFNKDEKDPDLKNNLYVVANYRGEAEFDQLDLGVYFNRSNVNLGFWYRGLQGFKAYKPGYSNNDAVAFIFGIQKETFRFGYSYDISISKLLGLTRGAHEFSITYQFCNFKTKPRRQLISCPKF